MKTKIAATLGPSSSSKAMLRKMYINGLDEVRLNFSHGSHREHMERIRIVRRLNKKMRRAIKIMQDLEGNRIRLGPLKDRIELKKSEHICLTQENIIGNKKEIPFDYRGTLGNIKKGMFVFIDDGKIVLKVREKGKNRLKTKVIAGGILKERKGINIPGANLDFPVLSEKDRKDVKIAVQQKLDYVAQSFVRSAKDLKALKAIVKPKHPGCLIFAKIENRDALKNINEIIREADGIMVARGDLGISIPVYKVPVLQKEIIKKCRLKGKPVIVATQMLESMTEELVPTRAEVCDVANAVLDGASTLLLSGETAVGRYPDKVVEMMNKIIKNTEDYERALI